MNYLSLQSPFVDFGGFFIVGNGKDGCMITLVLGGARSGKSRYALALAEERFRKPLYLATAEARDEEMTDRIRRHRKERGKQWCCVEEPLDVARVIRRPSACDGILLDCLTLWLSNVLCQEGVRAVAKRKKDLLAALGRARKDVILVSNEVGLGVVPESKLGRDFRDLAGWLNQELAKKADCVVYVVAGLPMVLKGEKEQGL